MEKDSCVQNFKMEVRKQREWSEPAKSDSTGENREAEQSTQQAFPEPESDIICHGCVEILEYQGGRQRVTTFRKEKPSLRY